MKKIFAVLFAVALLSIGCSSFMEMNKPAILEGKIVDKYADVEHLTSGDCGWNDPRGYVSSQCTHFIRVTYYIVIEKGDKKQRVEVTEEEYDGLQKGWVVDVSKKYPYWAGKMQPVSY